MATAWPSPDPGSTRSTLCIRSSTRPTPGGTATCCGPRHEPPLPAAPRAAAWRSGRPTGLLRTGWLLVTLRIAIIGTGHVGNAMNRLLAPHARLVTYDISDGQDYPDRALAAC